MIERINKFVLKCDGCKKTIIEFSGENIEANVHDDSMFYCYEGCEYGNWIIQENQNKIKKLGLNLYKCVERATK
jgi:hypothetical protein